MPIFPRKPPELPQASVPGIAHSDWRSETCSGPHARTYISRACLTIITMTRFAPPVKPEQTGHANRFLPDVGSIILAQVSTHSSRQSLLPDPGTRCGWWRLPVVTSAREVSSPAEAAVRRLKRDRRHRRHRRQITGHVERATVNGAGSERQSSQLIAGRIVRLSDRRNARSVARMNCSVFEQPGSSAGVRRLHQHQQQRVASPPGKRRRRYDRSVTPMGRS